MKTLAAALTHVLLALALANSTACSTTQAVAKAPVESEAAKRAALVRELNALVAQGPLYFETDTDTLTEGSAYLLRRIAAQLHRVPRVRVIVGGHADERGDGAYNLALGERRGYAAREYLLKLGIPKERIRVVSLGEEQPIARGHDEDAWSQNRRDEFMFVLPDERRSVLSMVEERDAPGEVLASMSFASE